MPAAAARPATAPDASARARNAASRAASPRRTASALRNTAARYALNATVISPVTTERGLSQLVTRSPAALPTGTLPPAIAPTIIPSAIGVRIDETESTVSTARCSRPLRVPDRSAYAPPRRTMPTAATKNGIESVEAIDANTCE